MKRNHNRGVSFVELVIAVVIFGLMIGPIVSKLIQASKTADNSKVTQSKYEYAENLMENIKSAEDYFYDPSKLKNDPYLQQVTDGTISVSDKGKATTKSGTSFDGYVVTGKAKVGRGNKNYYYAIHVNNKAYAQEEEKNAAYQNPNKTSVPAVANFSSSDLAIINGTIGNYDLTVTNAFMSKKLDVLKLGDKTRWEQYTKQQADVVAFPNDTATRIIEISVEQKDEDYTVSCKLRYKDNSKVLLKDGIYKGESLSHYLDPIEYVPYIQTFKNGLPSIYLMYNPCLYNNNYMENDYILLDTSGLSSDTDVNVFVIETAEQYSQNIVEGMVDLAISQYKEEHKGKELSKTEIDQLRKSYTDKYLINMNAIRDRSNVNVNIMRDGSGKGNLKVYHNFGETTAEKKTLIGSINSSTKIDKSMTAGFSNVDEKDIMKMSESLVSTTPLYDVDVYISDSPFTITTYKDFIGKLNWDSEDYDAKIGAKYDGISPILTGTKGGK